jgi:hypothetical protein
MATDIVTPLPLKALASKLGVASPDRSLVKIGRASLPPPLTGDDSGVLEDGEIDEQQGPIGSLQGQFSLHRKPPS